MIISGFGWLCLVPGRIKSSFHWAAYWGENRGHSRPLSPAASFPIVHGYWMFPKEKNVASQEIYKTILIYALSLKSVWNHPRLHAQVLAAFLPVTGAMESPPRYSKGNRCTSSSAQAPSLCNHQLLGQSLLNSKADQRLFSLCLVCFLSPSSFSWCWCKLGAGLLKEMKLLEKRTGGKKTQKPTTKNTAQSSAGNFSFSVSSAEKKNWVISKITAQSPAFSLSSPFLYGRAIGQSCEQLHKVQQRRGGGGVLLLWIIFPFAL